MHGKTQIGRSTTAVDFNALNKLAEANRETTITILSAILDQDSTILVDPTWDTKEKELWSKKKSR